MKNQEQGFSEKDRQLKLDHYHEKLQAQSKLLVKGSPG